MKNGHPCPNFLAALCILALAACSPGGNAPSSQAQAIAPLSQQNMAAEPLPDFKDKPGFAYRGSRKRSPFEPPRTASRASLDPDGKRIAPDPQRRREHFEGFSLRSLTLVGTLSQGAVRRGLLRDGNGQVRQVQVGDYLGQDHGRIKQIREHVLEFEEIVADGVGGWAKRPGSLRLKPEEERP